MLQTLSYIINVAPEGVPQVVRLSQNENGRTLAFTLTGAGTVNIPSGSTVTISGTKPDGVVYSQTGTISGTTASFPETTQMTAVSGIWPAKIKVTYNGETIATCKIVMAIDPDPVAPGSVPSSSQLNGLVAEAQQYATYAKYEAFGSPLVAATAAAMTDKTRVYVYTGSETGKTAGHWYYWNGSAWTDGGVYNSQGINTDTTLTLSGMAADAKAVGDEFTHVKQDISELSEETRNIFDKNNSDNILNGYYIDGSGNVASNATTAMVICECEPNTTYTISKMLTEHFRIATYASKPVYQSHSLASPTTNDSARSITITTPATAAWVGIYVYNSSHDTGVTLQQVIDTIQVEAGATATPYVQHITAEDLIARGTIEEITPKVETTETKLAVLTDKSIVYSQNIANPALFGEKGTWYYQGVKYTSGNTYTDNSIAFIFEPIIGATYYVGRYNINDGAPVTNSNFALYFTAWDEDDNYLPYATEQNVASFTVTEHTAKIALTIMLYSGSSQVANAYVSTEQCPATFVPFSEYDMHSAKADIDALKSGGIALNINLPNTLYAVVGSELNIYFDNIINTDGSEYHINVDCSIGEQLDRCYRVTPTTAGTYSLSISYEKNGAVLQKSVTLKVLNANTSTDQTAKVLVIGDSTTNGGVAVHKLMDDATGKRIAVSLLGTRGDAPYLHEGRSGWTANYYVNLATDGTYTNAFYNPSTQKFDFAYYLTHNNIDTPDLVIINLGINDVFNPTNDSDLATAINTYLECVEYMIDSIQSAASSTKIGIAVTIPPNYSQDAFGKAYGCGQTRTRYKLNNNRLGESIINTFANRTAENVYVIPIHTNLDTVYNMATEQTQVNSRNEATYISPTGYASVHPDTSGLWQVADVYWYTLTAIFTNAY